MKNSSKVPGDIRQEIILRLTKAEQEHEVSIIYACESGSRAWGFPSPDSDYDVRFLYVRKPDWYLSFDIENRRDVIEYPIVDEIDCNGWDLKKALHLLTRTNGALIEWLNSPIKYIEKGETAARLRELAPLIVNDIALRYHYSHMMRRHNLEQLKGKEIKLKRYFYILRPLLAIRYIENGLGLPPVEFSTLIDSACPQEIKPDIEKLIALKRLTPELGLGEPVSALDNFIASEIQRHGDRFTGTGRPVLDEKSNVMDQLNSVFRAAIDVST